MNLHYRFWVEYYDALAKNSNPVSFAAHNEQFANSTWKAEDFPKPLSSQAIYLRVSYPGMLIGLGYSHSSNLSTDESPEIALGISLDYVTGLPLVPGSTVKGIIRSAFRTHPEFVCALASDLGLNDKDVADLEQISFGRPQESKASKCVQETGDDVFYDAWPSAPNPDGHLFGIESITPHISKDPAYQGLTGPNTLTLLKIMPATEFCFCFHLKDSLLPSGITVTAERKMSLYQAILCEMGVGAKTNVGFGFMHPVEKQAVSVSAAATFEEGEVIGLYPKNKGASIRLDSGRKGGINAKNRGISDIGSILAVGDRVRVRIISERTNNNGETVLDLDYVENLTRK